MRKLQKRVLDWVASAAVIVALAIWLAGCSTAQPPQRSGPDLEAAGAAILAQDQKQLQTLGGTLQMCTNGVQQMLVLCPKVDKKLPFDQGIKACLKEAQANQKK